jgi:hypothetical protein
MNKDIFKPFLNNRIFTHTIDYYKATETKVKGRNKIVYATAIKQKAVFVSAKAEDLIKAGFDKFIDNDTFYCFTKFNFELGMNDIVAWAGKRYQRINSNNFQEYGFNKYIVSVYNDVNLNKETIGETIDRTGFIY